jgi:hypothetical protein
LAEQKLSGFGNGANVLGLAQTGRFNGHWWKWLAHRRRPEARVAAGSQYIPVHRYQATPAPLHTAMPLGQAVHRRPSITQRSVLETSRTISAEIDLARAVLYPPSRFHQRQLPELRDDAISVPLANSRVNECHHHRVFWQQKPERRKPSGTGGNPISKLSARGCKPFFRAGGSNERSNGWIARSWFERRSWRGRGGPLDHSGERTIAVFRVGPGIGGATKPDLVDIGGTVVYDPLVARLRRGEELPSAGILTLHHTFLDRLFTSGSGTSYAAPRVAFSAAQILGRFPAASANLIRALLVGSAEIPEPASERLALLGPDATRSVCGHGMVNLERAAFSDDARVVLYGEDELAIDHFAVYQIPIPEQFQTQKGDRCIRATLAYAPRCGTPERTTPELA